MFALIKKKTHQLINDFRKQCANHAAKYDKNVPVSGEFCGLQIHWKQPKLSYLCSHVTGHWTQLVSDVQP